MWDFDTGDEVGATPDQSKAAVDALVSDTQIRLLYVQLKQAKQQSMKSFRTRLRSLKLQGTNL